MIIGLMECYVCMIMLEIYYCNGTLKKTFNSRLVLRVL